MNREDIIRMARESGFNLEQGFLLRVTGIDEDLERFAAFVAAAEREKVAQWMISHGYATGHGDTTEELLKELEWQIAERTQ
jgi:5,10-methylenetetrahydrofolate reductase